jgi:Cytochrome C and Quinol oxidase polypeptide I
MQSADSEAVLNLAFVAAQCTGECWRWERLRNCLRSSLATIMLHSRASYGWLDTVRASAVSRESCGRVEKREMFVSPQVFNRLFTMHGTTMVFFVGMPILFGFGNYHRPAPRLRDHPSPTFSMPGISLNS